MVESLFPVPDTPTETVNCDLLIVEDNVDLQEYYHILFGMTPWNIVALLADGLEAISYYKDLYPKPSVILLDIDLPGCSGLQVAEHILQAHPAQKIVFVSGVRRDLVIPTALQGIPWIDKPFRIDDLLDTLETLRGQETPEPPRDG